MPKARNEIKLKEEWAREIDPEAFRLPNSHEKAIRREDRAVENIPKHVLDEWMRRVGPSVENPEWPKRCFWNDTLYYASYTDYVMSN